MVDSWEVANGLNHLADDAGDDPDGDTRSNIQEYNAGSNPHVRDWLGAGTACSPVFTLNTESAVADSDGDGMPDWWEDLHSLNNGTDDSGADPDNDGLTNIEEYAAGSDPHVSDLAETWSGVSSVFTLDTGGYPFVLGADSDSDGMPDWWESKYGLDIDTNDAAGDLDHDGLSNLEEYQLGMNPAVNDRWGEHSAMSPLFTLDTIGLAPDSDGDGMPDWWESAHGLNIAQDDSGDDPDRDGRTNIEEYNANTDPQVFEYPGLAHGLSPVFTLDTGEYAGGHGLDSDGDGMPDWWETKYGLATGSNDSGGNPDGDSFINLQEYRMGGNPREFEGQTGHSCLSAAFVLDTGGHAGGFSADTDGDGMPDWWEEKYGLTVGIDDHGGNLDNDGLTNIQEYRAGALPNVFDHPIPHLNESNIFVLDTGGEFTDTDGDGIPDWWEWVHFGSKLVAMSNQDADNDGFSNLREYIAGTDPWDVMSMFHITSITPPAPAQPTWKCVVTWDTVPDRQYSVFTHSDMMTAWSTEAVYQVQGDGTPKSYTNTFERSQLRFYRIGVELVP